jgi:hypothetical protein
MRESVRIYDQGSSDRVGTLGGGEEEEEEEENC